MHRNVLGIMQWDDGKWEMTVPSFYMTIRIDVIGAATAAEQTASRGSAP
jgi:hypothetical protein